MLTIDQLNDPQIIRAQQAICAANFVSAYNALIQEWNDSIDNLSWIVDFETWGSFKPYHEIATPEDADPSVVRADDTLGWAYIEWRDWLFLSQIDNDHTPTQG